MLQNGKKQEKKKRTRFQIINIKLTYPHYTTIKTHNKDTQKTHKRHTKDTTHPLDYHHINLKN